MSGDDAQELRDTTIRHDERIRVLEAAIETQEPKLDAIINTLAKLSSYNIEVAQSIKKAVFGNGQPGLVTTMTQLIERTESRKETHDKDMNRIERIFCWSGVGLVSVLTGIIVYLAKLHFGGG